MFCDGQHDKMFDFYRDPAARFSDSRTGAREGAAGVEGLLEEPSRWYVSVFVHLLFVDI